MSGKRDLSQYLRNKGCRILRNAACLQLLAELNISLLQSFGCNAAYNSQPVGDHKMLGTNVHLGKEG